MATKTKTKPPKPNQTGPIFKIQVRDYLRSYGYEPILEYKLGNHPWGSKHRVDIFLPTEGIAISCKFQSVGGTADEKIAHEVVAMRHRLDAQFSPIRKAYIVMGGDGAREVLTTWYDKGGLDPFFKGMEKGDIIVLSYTAFQGRVARGEL